MNKLNLVFTIMINAKPDFVFGFVGDLMRHPEWSSDRMQMELVSQEPAQVGSRYRSTNKLMNAMTVVDDLEVTQYQPPTRFAFMVEDMAGTFEHIFTLKAQDEGTLVERAVNASSKPNLILDIIRPIMMPFLVRLINAESNKALALLKAKVEQSLTQ